MLQVSGDIVLPAFRGRTGHPVLLQSHLIPEILGQPEDATLRDIVQAHGYTEVRVQDESILLDVDTPSDYQTVLARYCARGAECSEC
jgi:molybdenum cofactor cytidylyltransferase